MRRTLLWTDETRAEAGITVPPSPQQESLPTNRICQARLSAPPAPPKHLPKEGHVGPDSSAAHVSSSSPAVNSSAG